MLRGREITKPTDLFLIVILCCFALSLSLQDNRLMIVVGAKVRFHRDTHRERSEVVERSTGWMNYQRAAVK